jgi:RNA polymerase sigma-70 factor (ECF subfamily)
MVEPHDAELMARWQDGDAAAFEALVRRWQQPLARFLHRLAGRAGSVHDLCQEVFLRLYHAPGSYRERGHFAAWLYRVALNVARDAGRRRLSLPLERRSEPADPSAPAEAVCQQRELADLVSRAVAELPEPLRLVLALHHDEGLNFEEISRLTGTPASTLKSRFAAALRRLRQRLAPEGYGPQEDDQ